MKKSTIIIPFDIPFGWSTNYTIKTAELLSKKHLVLCLLLEDSFSLKEYLVSNNRPKIFEKYTQNIYLFKPLQLIPFRRYTIIHEFNIFINKLFTIAALSIYYYAKKNNDKYIWLFHPKTYPFIEKLSKKYKIIYDCVDYFDIGTSIDKQILKNQVKKLTDRAFLIVANSKILQKKLKNITKKKVYLVPQGFDIKVFTKYERKKTNPEVNLKIDTQKPVVGYIGGINHRLDLALLYKLSDRNPQWNFVIWGPIQKPDTDVKKFYTHFNSIIAKKNVFYGMSKNRDIIPAVIDKFDIATIPYKSKLDFNRYCYPMKLFEYFYMGKPVISTPIEELKRFISYVKITDSVKGWENNITKILSLSWPINKKNKQLQLAVNNSWENKIDTILDLIEKKC